MSRPGSPEINFHLAEALFRDGNQDGALERYYAAVEADHEYLESWTQIGCIHAAQGRAAIRPGSLLDRPFRARRLSRRALARGRRPGRSLGGRRKPPPTGGSTWNTTAAARGPIRPASGWTRSASTPIEAGRISRLMAGGRLFGRTSALVAAGCPRGRIRLAESPPSDNRHDDHGVEKECREHFADGAAGVAVVRVELFDLPLGKGHCRNRNGGRGRQNERRRPAQPPGPAPTSTPILLFDEKPTKGQLSFSSAIVPQTRPPVEDRGIPDQALASQARF